MNIYDFTNKVQLAVGGIVTRIFGRDTIPTAQDLKTGLTGEVVIVRPSLILPNRVVTTGIESVGVGPGGEIVITTMANGKRDEVARWNALESDYFEKRGGWNPDGDVTPEDVERSEES